MERQKTKRILIGKNNTWSANVTIEEVETLVMEGAAVVSENNEMIYKMLFEESDLLTFVIEREKSKCRCCEKEAVVMKWLQEEQEGGVLSPRNIIAVCSSCQQLKIESHKIDQWKEENEIYMKANDQMKKCVLCENEKKLHEFSISSNEKVKSFCKTCEENRKHEGVVTIIGQTGKEIRKVSTNKAKSMIQKGFAEYIGVKNKIRIKGSISRVIYGIKDSIKHIFNAHKNVIVVSKSGKWSAEATEVEALNLIEGSLAEYQGEGVLRMVVNIEDFKGSIVQRDNNTCQFCGKRGSGVYSTSAVKTYQNSVCACMTCEYERDVEKFLKWVNIKEEKSKFPPLLLWKSDKLTILYEKNENRKYRIRKEIAERLVREEMADRMEEGKIKIKYEVKEFRNFILERDGRICFYCNKKGNTVDHILAKAKGGLTTPENCVCACKACNGKKGSMHKNSFIKMVKREAMKEA